MICILFTHFFNLQNFFYSGIYFLLLLSLFLIFILKLLLLFFFYKFDIFTFEIISFNIYIPVISNLFLDANIIFQNRFSNFFLYFSNPLCDTKSHSSRTPEDDDDIRLGLLTIND